MQPYTLTNQKRSATFIKLLHSIKSCNRYYQLRQIAEKVVDHSRKFPEERDILVEYWQKEGQLIID